MTRPEPHRAWDFLKSARDDDIPLVWAALTIARDEYPDLDLDACEAQLDGYGARVRARLPEDATPVDRIRVVNEFLFEEMGFSGNQQDYYDPRNSYLNDVLERKLGIPLSLGLIQLELARRNGVPLRGVSFPGHFLTSMAVDGGLLVLDPYLKGRSVDAQELRLRAKPHVGDVEVPDEQLSHLLAPAGHRAILARMLRNLKALYAEREDYERALRSTDRLLTLDASQPSELRDRGLLYLRVGHIAAGRQDLAKYLEREPSADDADEIREMLIATSGRSARLN